MDWKSKYIKYKNKYLLYKQFNEQKEINNIDGGTNFKKRSKKNKKNLKNQISRTNPNTIDTNIPMKTSPSNLIPKYSEHLSEPWFSLITLGLKTVEGRKNKGKFKDMEVGDIIEWVNNDFMERKILTKVISKAEYPTFSEYLQTEGLDKCLPGMEKFGLEHGLSVYFKYFTKEDEATYGVVAIRLELIK